MTLNKRTDRKTTPATRRTCRSPSSGRSWHNRPVSRAAIISAVRAQVLLLQSV